MSETLKQKIVARMTALDISPKRSLGQNFLISDSVVDKIMALAQPEKFDQTIEVGPGLGALTDHLIKKSQKLTLIELDKAFAKFWTQKEQTVLEADALMVNWSELLDPSLTTLLVSNLPYQISSRLVVDLTLQTKSFDRMVLMFQKEVAQRMTAEPSSSQYGLLTVITRAYWDINLGLEAGPVDFFPKPNVASRVLVFRQKKELPPIESRKDFLNFVKISFAHRRKKLLPKLVSVAPLDKLKQSFLKVGLGEDVRAEKLSPQKFIELYLELKKE